MSENIINVTDADFATKVLGSDKPVLVDFWAEWCGPCKMIGASLEEIAADVADQIIIAKVDVDSNSQTSMQFGIRNIPALFIFKGGEVQGQAVGALNKTQLLEFINEHA